MSIQISFSEKWWNYKKTEELEDIFFKKFIKTKFKKHIQMDMWYKEAKEEFTLEHPEYKKWLEPKEKIKSTKFLTFRPTDETTIEQLFYGTQEWLSRRWIKEFKLVFEQKGETKNEIGRGKHIHIIFSHTQKSKGEMIDEIQRDYKKYNIVFANNQPKIDDIKTTADLERITNYIGDYKEEDELKKKAFAMDSIYRDQIGLRRFYDIAPLPTPKGLNACPYNQVHDGTSKIIELMKTKGS